MKQRLIYIIGVVLLLLSPVLSHAQITYQYWIDDNKEAAVSGTTTDGKALSLSINAAELTTGIHYLNMRAREGEKWGTVYRKLFNIPRKQQTDAGKLITGYRYGFGDVLTTVTFDTPVSEYKLTKLLDVPEPPQPVTIDDDCHFSFNEGEATLQRNVEMSFILTFTDQSNAMSSPAGTTFTVTDIQTTDILKFNVPGSQTIPAHASGGYTVTQFDIASAGTYILKSTETCSLRLYSKEEGFINGITSEGLTAGYPKELAIGTYYAVAFGNATETSLSVNPDDPSLITVATPVFSYEGDVITITTATPNATIYYTVDGSIPTAESTLYTEPFTVTENGTIFAIAKRDGYKDSEIALLEVDWIVVGTPCGYAIYDSETSTLTFKYGIMPEGDNVWETDDTGTTAPSWSKSQIQNVIFESSYAQARPKSTNRWFAGLSKITKITGLEYLNTSQVTDMGFMFYNCSGLTSLNVSSFYTANVTNMNYMFYNCSGLTSLNVSNFNTSNVTNMSYMFCDCSKLTSLNVSNFNTENVTNMSYMFYGCSGVTSLNVSGFNTANVINMNYMFSGCSGLTSLNLSNFDTSKVTNMGYMFYNCSGLTSLNVSNFNTENVSNMSGMFYNCSGLTSLNVTNFKTENVTSMASMFYNCSSLTSLNVSGFNTSNVTNMGSMFCKCSKLTSLDVSNFDTKKVTGMGYMFSECSGLASLDLSNFDTSNVTSMSAMFNMCYGLKSLNISSFDTGKVTSMSGMFNSCNGLTSLDLSSFNTSNVKSMDYMFCFCNSLTSLDVSNFDTGNVTNMSAMFQDCANLTSLDLSNFRTDNVTDMRAMFNYCLKLKNLDISHFNTEKVTNMDCMFELCIALTELDLTHFNTSSVTDMNRMFNECCGLTSLKIGNFNTSKVTNMKMMFAKTNSLTTLDLSSFDTSSVTAMDSLFCSTGDSHHLYWWNRFLGYNMPTNNWTTVTGSKLTTIYASKAWTTAAVVEDDYMFVGCTALKGGKGTTYNASNVKKSYARIDGGNAAPGYFTEKSYILGDADGDTKVDVNDVTSTINYILNKPVAKFIKEAADMDKDGKIDVNDVQAIIYKALGKE